MSEPRKECQSIRLGDAGTWLSGGTPSTDEPRYWGGEIPWISASSLSHFRVTDSRRRITNLGAHSGTQLVSTGTVVFVVRGMSLKKEVRVGVAQRQIAFGQDCKAIVPRAGIDGTFLGLAIKARANEILGMVDEAGHGTGRLPTDLIERLEVWIPPLPEQKQISEFIETLDQEIHKIEQMITKCEHLRVGSIRAAMRDGLSLLMGAEASELASTPVKVHGIWEIVPLGRRVTGIDAGHSPDLEDVPAGPGEWGVLKVSAIRKDGFHPEENKVARDRALKRAALCVRPGDLLIARANTSQLVGLCCIVRDTPAGLMLCDKTLRLRVHEQSTPAEFIDLVLGMAEVRRQIEIAATGTSGSMKNVSQGAIKRLMIPWASPEVIAGIVRSNEAFKQRIAALRRGVRKLRLLQQGLMDDLLTGRVRVPLGDGHRG